MKEVWWSKFRSQKKKLTENKTTQNGKDKNNISNKENCTLVGIKEVYNQYEGVPG